MCCRRLVLLYFLLTTGGPVMAQISHYPPDSIVDPFMEPDREAARLQSILWHLVINIQDLGDLPYAASLDSVMDCCISAKPNHARAAQQLAADAFFFKGSTLTHADPVAARRIIESAILKFRQLGDSTRTILGFMQLCWTLSNLGDSTGFVAVRDQVMHLLPHLQDTYIATNILSTLGVGCYDFGLYAEAAAHYFEALNTIDAGRTPELLRAKRDLYHNLGGVYARIGDQDNALLYVRKAIASAKETQQDTLDHYLLLGRVLIVRKAFKEALHALKQTEHFEFIQANAIGKGQNAYSQATCYRHLGHPDSAFWYARTAVRLLPVSVNAQYGAAALLELAACEFALQMDSALYHANHALIELGEAKYTSGMVEAAALLAAIYKSKGDFKQALHYSELQFTYQNQIERWESSRQLAFGEFAREHAAEQARREAAMNAELNRQRSIRYGLFAGLGILALIAFLLYHRYRFKQRTTRQLEAKNAEIEAARIRAEQSEAFKSRFLANMSHEIRTPLHGISGFADLLRDTSMTEKQRRWLHAIEQSAMRLREVVNDILDLSKLEAGEMGLRKVVFSPRQIVRDIAETLEPVISGKGIALDIDVHPDCPAAVVGDPTRLYQVLINVAGNAVKFTEKGTVTISVTSNQLNTPGLVSVEFAIKDTGIGIAPDKLAAIFDSFRQADDATASTFGGTGLGLTIARDLVRLHGSDITVTSSPGIGSEFRFAIEWPIADEIPALQYREHEMGQYVQPVAVLVVDDNAFNREISEEALYRHFVNAKVDLAMDGYEAVEKADKQAYDVVLMDLQMPGMNGMDATRTIRTGGGPNRNAAIIALTASATAGEIQAALASGMNRHLGKPFQPYELAVVIADLLNLGPKESPSTVNNPIIAASSDGEHSLAVHDLSFLRDFCEGNEEQVSYFLEKFERQWPAVLERLAMAFEKQDVELIYTIAHSFRPQLEFVGLSDASGMLLKLEQRARQGASLHELKIIIDQLDKRLASTSMPKK